MTLRHDVDGFLVGTSSGTVALHGILEHTLGGFPVIRGYARMSQLAARSHADEAYQRQLKPDHQRDIQEFYDRGENLFFPELVLSIELQVDYERPNVPSSDPIRLIQSKENFKSNVNDVEVKFKRSRARQQPPIQQIEIKLPEEAGSVLKRVDGNHRLSAFEEMTDVGNLDRYPVSFCIILLPQSSAIHREKTLFYNINSKAQPLTSEEVYKGIIDDDNFTEDEILRDFGDEFLLARSIRQRLDFNYLQNLRTVFGQSEGSNDCRCTVLIEVLRTLRKERERLGRGTNLPSSDSVLDAVREINNSYADPRLVRSQSTGLFAAFVFFKLEDDARKYRQFLTWVLKNHQYELTKVHASDLIRIFEKIAQARKRKIFLSMQFSDETQGNFDAINNAINDLNREHELSLELIRIDQYDTGYSYEINDEILSQIADAGLLIADLTCGNKLVYHEVGYLMGLNQGKGLAHENFILVHNDSIGDTRQDIGFGLASIRQFRVSDTNTLRENIKQQIAIYYGVGQTEDSGA